MLAVFSVVSCRLWLAYAAPSGQVVQDLHRFSGGFPSKGSPGFPWLLGHGYYIELYGGLIGGIKIDEINLFECFRADFYGLAYYNSRSINFAKIFCASTGCLKYNYYPIYDQKASCSEPSVHGYLSRDFYVNEHFRKTIVN